MGIPQFSVFRETCYRNSSPNQNLWSLILFMIKEFVLGRNEKKETPIQVFSCENCKILRTPILKIICDRLLLKDYLYTIYF